jgi:PAS domain S-box-containing protein
MDRPDQQRADDPGHPGINLLRTVTAHLPMVLFAINRDGIFTLSDGKGLAALGLKPGQAVGISAFEMYRDVPDVLENLRAAFAGEERSGPNHVGSRVFDVTYSPIFDEHGVVDGVAGVAIDITEQAQAADRLRQTRDTLSAVVDSVPHAIFWKDRDGVFLGCNRVYASSAHIDDPSHIVGKTDYDVMPTREEAESFRAQDFEVMETGVARRHLIRSGVRSDGTEFWSDTTKVPLVDRDGRVFGVLGIYENITQKVRAEEHRQAMERRLLHSHKLESLGVMAGGIAHDFNNLLMAVLGNLDLAAQQMPPASPAMESIEQAIQATRRATDLTHQMLAYSGRGRFVIRRLDLGDVLRENSELFRAATSRTITFDLAVSPERASIDGDQCQVQQIVMNLITNASDAIGDRPGHIRLESGVAYFSDADLSRSRIEERPPAGRYSYIQVSDNGQGMDERTQERLFDPFFTTKFTGRGLGMSAVLGIVRGHRGAIFVDSAPGTGTTIRVLFSAVAAPVKSASDAGVVAVGDSSRSPQRRTILVVDDDDAVRRLCLVFVERLGHIGLEAAHGEDALAIFKQRPDQIDCVLLDLTMPRMDGLRTFRALRAIRPDVPVILSSGYSEQDATHRFDGEGLTGFIQKPFRLADFKSALAGALAGID